MGKTSSYRESLLEALTDPEEAAAYLNAGLEDSLPAFLKALKNVTQAHQMTKVAKDSGVQRETLYRSLLEQGNPTLQTLTSVLGAMGLRMRVEAEVAGAVDVSGGGCDEFGEEEKRCGAHPLAALPSAVFRCAAALALN